jgi:hypothetical protein
MAKRTTKRNASGRFERCVAKVSKRPGVASPRGVCAAAGRKKYGVKKFAAMSAAGKRKAAKRNASWRRTVKATKKARRRIGITDKYPSRVKQHYSRTGETPKQEAMRRTRAGGSILSNAGSRAKKKNKGRRPAKRKNPLDAAQTVYRKFHGRGADKVLTVDEKMHVHKYLSGIGDLVGLQVLTHDGRAKVTLKFDAGAVLAQNEKRNQLFIRGGDQSVNLKDFGVTGPIHELEDLGQVIWISYYTRKDHLAPEDGGEAIYKHHFGRKKPTLIYDTVNKKMELAGGGYDIPDEGIDK